MNLEKEKLIKVLDDFVKLKGIAEAVSDIGIKFAVNFLENKVWPNLSEKGQGAVNEWINIQLEEATTKDPDDDGDGPGDPRP